MRRKFFVNIKEKDISEQQPMNMKGFTIYATEDEKTLLQAKMARMEEEDITSFFRAHIPFISYEENNPNHSYDSALMDIYSMIYQLGDEETRKSLKEMNVFP